MKAVLIASDLMLDESGEAKMVEMNTNGGIYDIMVDELDYSGLIDIITSNNIDELHFIFGPDLVEKTLILNGDQIVIRHLGTKLKEICDSINITYHQHNTESGSITVPNIEDAPNKLILRQSYDGTALVDESYCSDKLGLQELIKDEPYAIPTYLNNGITTINTLTTIKNTSPNVILKSRYPNYDSKVYPELYQLNSVDELNTLKESLNGNYYLQEFINNSNNQHEDKNGIIRSIDIIYGDELDVLHLGSYVNTSSLKIDVWADEKIDGTNKLNNKSRSKWITKLTNDIQNMDYHVDNQTFIINSENQHIGINDIQIGTTIKTIQFSNFPTNLDYTYMPSITSTINEMENTKVISTANVINIENEVVETIFIGVELEDGTYWEDSSGSNFYVEDKDSNLTHFKRLNIIEIGDKIILLNNNDNSLVKKEITNLTIVYGRKTIYSIDVEDIDIFLSILDDVNDLLLIQHNIRCDCCYGFWSCGSYCCSTLPVACPGCAGACFIEGSLVSTIGGTKKINEISIGDIVLSYDLDMNSLVTKKVDGLFKKDYDGSLLVINGFEINATIGHPLAVKDSNNNLSWAAYDPTIDKEYHRNIDVIKLEVKEHKINLNGEWITIDKIELKPYNGLVYNITVEDTHNYIVENVLVHNMPVKKEVS